MEFPNSHQIQKVVVNIRQTAGQDGRIPVKRELQTAFSLMRASRRLKSCCSAQLLAI